MSLQYRLTVFGCVKSGFKDVWYLVLNNNDLMIGVISRASRKTFKDTKV